MAAIDIGNITRVYSGKRGCMCGCLGKYTANPAYKEQVGKERGWALSDADCNERSVKIIAKKVLNNPNTNFTESQEYCFLEDVEKNTIKVVYFKKKD